jgi:ribonuclease BN (tRNA processing enzyme)
MRLMILFFMLLSACSQNTRLAKNNSYCSKVRLQVLGAGGPEINDGLASASFLIWVDGKARVMVDAGGGSSFNFEKSGANFNHLQAILLTHLHVDHSAALPIYIKAGYFTGREQILPIFGPDEGGDFPSTENFVAALFSDQQKSAYPYLSDNFRQQSSTDFLIHAGSVSPNNKIWKKQLSEEISIESINVNHGPIPAVAWRVNLGQCAITFSGDMNGNSGNLQKLAANSNLLVANNAVPQDANRFAKRLHMTPKIIGEIAAEAKVQQLVLAHFMLRTLDRKEQTQQLIKQHYSGPIILANELSFVELYR